MKETAEVTTQLTYEEISSQLDDLPDVTVRADTAKEAVNKLADKLFAALAKGHSYTQLAQLLKQWGISLAESTLKGYLVEIKRDRLKAERKAKREAKKLAHSSEDESANSLTQTALSSEKPRASSTTTNSNYTDNGFALMPDEL
jgi:hypothetical protein